MVRMLEVVAGAGGAWLAGLAVAYFSGVPSTTEACLIGGSIVTLFHVLRRR